MSRIFQFSLVFVLGLEILLPCAMLGSGPNAPADSGVHRMSSRTEGDRDPTAPSARILERLGATVRNTSVPASLAEKRLGEAPSATKIPEIRLKAIVFRDADHGSAILAVNGRNITLKLSRSQGAQAADALSRSPNGFTQDGIHFALEDFSEDSIKLRLSSDNSVLIVQ